MINDIAGHQDLTDKIIECRIKVHEYFGPGLLESVYKACLALELREAGLKVDTTRRVALVYKTLDLNAFYCPDIVVNDAPACRPADELQSAAVESRRETNRAP